VSKHSLYWRCPGCGRTWLVTVPVCGNCGQSQPAEPQTFYRRASWAPRGMEAQRGGDPYIFEGRY